MRSLSSLTALKESPKVLFDCPLPVPLTLNRIVTFGDLVFFSPNVVGDFQ